MLARWIGRRRMVAMTAWPASWNARNSRSGTCSTFIPAPSSNRAADAPLLPPAGAGWRRRGRLGEVGEPLGELIDADQLVELADGNAEDVRGAGAADDVDQTVGDHLLFLRVPFLALAVDVDPDAQTLVVGQRAIGDLQRD